MDKTHLTGFDGYNVSVVQCALYENGTLKIGMHLCPREKTASKAVFPENSVFLFQCCRLLLRVPFLNH